MPSMPNSQTESANPRRMSISSRNGYYEYSRETGQPINSLTRRGKCVPIIMISPFHLYSSRQPHLYLPIFPDLPATADGCTDVLLR